MNQICRYRFDSDDWVWNSELSDSTIKFGIEEDDEATFIMQRALQQLSASYPDEENNVFKPAYDHLKAGK